MHELPEGQTLLPKPLALSLFNDHFSFFLNAGETSKVLGLMEKEFQRHRVENRMIDAIDLDVYLNVILFEFVE